MQKLIKFLTFWIPVKKLRKKVRAKLELFFISFIPLEKNWIVFYDTFSKNGNGDNVKALALYLRQIRPNFKFFFIAKQLQYIDMADEVLIIGSNRFKEVVNRAKYLISPMDLPCTKRKGQVWVMTWHGAPIKKLYLSRNKDNQQFIDYVEPFKYIDLFCVSADVFHDVYQEAMHTSEECFLNSGSPRNDFLFQSHNEEYKDKIKTNLGLPKNKKILFYTPTWRRDDCKMPLAIDLVKLKQAIGNEYCIMLRSHVGRQAWIDANGNLLQLPQDDFYYNVADYENISELYLIADINISDYSSTFFDFAITKKPQIFYPYDLHDYEKEFGLYFDYKEFASGPVATNTEELIECVLNIKNFNKNYGSKYEAFIKKFITYEQGNASQIVINEMLNFENRGK